MCVLAKEHTMLARLVVALALIVGAVAVEARGAPHIGTLTVSFVAVFSAAAGIAMTADVFVEYWLGRHYPGFKIINRVAGCAAILDGLILISPTVWP
jgi:hypothetical protein